MERILTQLVEKLQKSYGDRLVSVVLYGSAVTGDHHPKFSDWNVLCVLSQVTPDELKASAEIFRWWREQGSPAPLLLSEHELQTSSDCFAIEFTDIREHHRILHGRDVVADITVGRHFYRAQVERDLRAKLLRLRQKAAGMIDDENLLRRLLADSVSTFLILFRHALLLAGHAPGARKREILDASAQAFGVDAAPFATLLDMREERVKPRAVNPVALIGPYMAGISRVIDAVDRLAKS